MYARVTAKRNNSMLCGRLDKGSDWTHISRVIGNRFIKISNKNDQAFRRELTAYRPLVFTPTPIVVCPCPPKNKPLRERIPGNEVRKSVQSPEKSSSQKNNRNERKFRSFPLQISGLVSIKVRVIYKLMIVFLLHDFQTNCSFEICAVAVGSWWKLFRRSSKFEIIFMTKR